jgi:hypothetical protein
MHALRRLSRIPRTPAAALSVACLTVVLLGSGHSDTGRPLAASQIVGGQPPTSTVEARLRTAESTRPVAFEPSPLGERDGFLARTARYDVTFAAQGAVFQLRPASGVSEPRGEGARAMRGAPERPRARVRGTPPKAIGMTLVGAQSDATVRATGLLPGRVNYLLGSDSTAWRRNIPTYARVLEHDAWPGVDVAYYGNGGHVETDFVVAPGGDPDRIVLDFTGARDVRVDRDGALRLTASDGQTLGFLAPAIYQVDGSTRTPLSGRYVLENTSADDEGRRVHFALGAYDRTKTLVIDPLALVYSTYVDPGGYNVTGEAIAVDDHGHPFVAGSDATISENSFLMPLYGFVSKYSADGRDVLWTTYIGEGVSHSLDDVFDGIVSDNGPFTEVQAIALDGEHAVITGWTNAPHFPKTAGAFHNPNLGPGIGPYVYVAKLTDNGDDLVYASHPITIGKGFGIGVDQAGRVFVAGMALDQWLPTTQDAVLQQQPATEAGFLVELSVDGSKIVYGTYIGPDPGQSEGYTYAFGVAVDPSGGAYVVGKTYTHRLVTKNAFQPHIHDLADCPTGRTGDGFVMKLGPQHHLVYSSYLGGGCEDSAYAAAVGSGGSAYVTGSTQGQGFPCLHSVQSQFPCEPLAVPAVFVTKVHPDGQSLAYSTVLGPGEGFSIAELQGHAYITGWTSAYDFPVHRALQPNIGGSADAFVSEIRDDGSGLVFSTFLGGSDYEQGNGIAVGVNGGVYVTGLTESTDFPTHHAQQGQNQFGIPMAFLSKLKLE